MKEKTKKTLCKLLKDACTGKEVTIQEESIVQNIGAVEEPDSYIETTTYKAKIGKDGTITIRKEEPDDDYH